VIFVLMFMTRLKDFTFHVFHVKKTSDLGLATRGIVVIKGTEVEFLGFHFTT